MRKEFQPITTSTVPSSLDYDYFTKQYLVDIDSSFHGEIAHAFAFAQGAHAGKNRESGEPAFSHPLMCAIYVIELGFNQPNLIKATLLHDTPEDGTRYLKHTKMRIDQSRILAQNSKSDPITFSFSKYDLMCAEFDKETADIVQAVTRGPNMKQSTYTQRLRRGPSLARPVKGVDRLHNLRTLPLHDPNRVRRKIDETREDYMPIFEMAANDFPNSGERLYWLIDLELNRLEEGLTSPSPEQS